MYGRPLTCVIMALIVWEVALSVQCTLGAILDLSLAPRWLLKPTKRTVCNNNPYRVHWLYPYGRQSPDLKGKMTCCPCKRKCFCIISSYWKHDEESFAHRRCNNMSCHSCKWYWEPPLVRGYQMCMLTVSEMHAVLDASALISLKATGSLHRTEENPSLHTGLVSIHKLWKWSIPLRIWFVLSIAFRKTVLCISPLKPKC